MSHKSRRLEQRRHHADAERRAIDHSNSLKTKVFRVAKSQREAAPDPESFQESFVKALHDSSFEALVDLLAEKKVIDRTQYNIRRFQNVLAKLEPPNQEEAA